MREHINAETSVNETSQGPAKAYIVLLTHHASNHSGSARPADRRREHSRVRQPRLLVIFLVLVLVFVFLVLRDHMRRVGDEAGLHVRPAVRRDHGNARGDIQQHLKKDGG